MQILVLPVIVRDLDAQVKHMKEKKVFFQLTPELAALPRAAKGLQVIDSFLLENIYAYYTLCTVKGGDKMKKS